MLLKLIKALFVIFIGYPLYFVSFFTRRNSNIWVFGSFGVFNDNSRYLYEYVINEDKKVRAIWISKNKDSVKEARKFGEAYDTYSLKGVYYSLIAKVYIFSAYISEINFFTSANVIKVNLWHGIPLKKIEFDITTQPLVNLFRDASLLRKIVAPATQVKYDLLLSPAQYVSDYAFKSAFRISDNNIVIAQCPRVTHLQKCEPLDEYGIYNKVFLYAPTWRDDGRDFFKQSKLDFQELNNLMLKMNSIFLVKLHSATKITLDVSKFSNIKLVNNMLDPIRLMKTADCLITDYSSIYLDYLVLNRPIIHFCFDLDDYSRNREMYFDYESAVCGSVVRDFEELMQTLNRIENIPMNWETRTKFLSSSSDASNGNQVIVNRIKSLLVK
ncbi:CDP-glycerol glycerophosphotransferase family protein [Lonepinella sp. BR2357]|uniref:CDP-glycerol glycerophosphotransferase family protein n=1 Tax=Lonepinella sp. BR2357 TaxID=3434549 RepID=UPI003F6E3480